MVELVSLINYWVIDKIKEHCEHKKGHWWLPKLTAQSQALLVSTVEYIVSGSSFSISALLF